MAIAVILLLLVPAVVAGMYWQQGASNRSEAESLLDLAQACRPLSAEGALDQEDKSTACALLTEAYDYVLQSEEILGRTTRSDLIDQILVRTAGGNADYPCSMASRRRWRPFLPMPLRTVCR